MQRTIVHDNHVRKHISKKPLRPYILIHNLKAERAHTGNGMRIFETSKAVSIDRPQGSPEPCWAVQHLGIKYPNIEPMAVILVQATTSQLRNSATYVLGRDCSLFLFAEVKSFS